MLEHVMPEADRSPTTILMADDDEDDRLMTGQALDGAGVDCELRCVKDGQELMDYLNREGTWTGDASRSPRPAIILLDLNMPRKDGREALSEIKADPALRQIPIVVLTTSTDEKDAARAYQLGVSSYITKPVTFSRLSELMQMWKHYWFEVATLPDPDRREDLKVRGAGVG
jgi:CheY-like chemotaxis protein